MIELINREIDVIKSNQETRTHYIPALQIIYFVQQTQRFITLIKPENDYEMTQELLKLFDSAIGNRNTLASRPKRSTDDPSLRRFPIDSNHIRVVLELTENLLQSSHNATVIKMQQMKLIERIHQYLMQWCALEESTTEVLGEAFAAFEFLSYNHVFHSQTPKLYHLILKSWRHGKQSIEWGTFWYPDQALPIHCNFESAIYTNSLGVRSIV